MEKKTIIALVLFFLVFWLSNQFLWKNRTPETTETVVESREVSEPVVESELELSDPEISTTAGENEGLLTRADIAISDEIVLENDLMALVFTNRGGLLRSALLKEHKHYDKVNPVNLIPAGELLLGLEIETAEDLLFPDELVFNWEKTTKDGHQILTFYLESEGMRVIEKIYIINEDYALYKELSISGIGNVRSYKIGFNSGITDTEEKVKHKESDYRFIGQIQNSRTNIQLRRMNEREIIRGNVDWAAIRSKYFIMALIPEQRLMTDNVNVYSHNDSPAFELTIDPGRAVRDIYDRYEIYLGPLDYQNLQRYGIGLEETIEMGWKIIRPLSRLFLWVLTNLNRVFGNYGVTIIFFALLLKIILYPLTHKSYSSTHKMQKVQPYMQEIQRKYKSDPKQMQTELQKLYKEHGVNPLGGCFPLLLQMPVFLSLYPVLRYSIELRQASFVFWLSDLSEPDPFMILPILMGLFMFLQQRMMMPKRVNKEEMDEKQLAQMQSQKMMMYIMPVFLVFIFRSLPAGLVLYWTVFNIFSIIQQYFIMQKFKQQT